MASSFDNTASVLCSSEECFPFTVYDLVSYGEYRPFIDSSY